MYDFSGYLIVVIGTLIVIVSLIGLILGIKENIENETYQYECVTLDNETITCDRIKETESGIIGERDNTSYLIKQYKKVRKEK